MGSEIRKRVAWTEGSSFPGRLSKFILGFTWTEGSSLTRLLIVGSALPMFEICPEAQQAVVSALNAHHLQEQKVILCHSPGQIQATGFCSLGTHDLFRELVEDRHEDFISVFPNIQSVVNSMRRMQVNGFLLYSILRRLLLTPQTMAAPTDRAPAGQEADGGLVIDPTIDAWEHTGVYPQGFQPTTQGGYGSIDNLHIRPTPQFGGQLRTPGTYSHTPAEMIIASL